MCINLGIANKGQAKSKWELLLQGDLSEAGGSLWLRQTALLQDCVVRTILCLWRWCPWKNSPGCQEGFVHVCDMLPVNPAT